MAEITDFGKDVIEQSFILPVVADFWAEWCGPCRVLGPVLERLAAADGGRWALAKVNTEVFREESVRFGIQSIPNVKLFIDGNVAAGFVGALPEYAVRQWLTQHLPGKHEKDVASAAEMIARGRNREALELLESVIAAEPSDAGAKLLIARAVLYTDPARAAAAVADLDDPRHADQTEMIRVLLRCFGVAKGEIPLPEGDGGPLYREASQAVMAMDYDAALEKFIALIRRNRQFDDDGSRKACIAIFRWLGEDNPVTLRFRREFSSALY